MRKTALRWINRVVYLALLVPALLLPTHVASAQTVVDIDAVANATGDSTGSSFPSGAAAVTVNLTAGTYDLIPIDIANGGRFTAAEFCTCNNPPKYDWVYDFVTSEQSARERVTSAASRVGFESSASAAFSLAPTRRITLSNSGWIKFFIFDNPIGDNAGGMSLKIVPVTASPTNLPTMQTLVSTSSSILGLEPGPGQRRVGLVPFNDGRVVATYATGYPTGSCSWIPSQCAEPMASWHLVLDQAGIVVPPQRTWPELDAKNYINQGTVFPGRGDSVGDGSVAAVAMGHSGHNSLGGNFVRIDSSGTVLSRLGGSASYAPGLCAVGNDLFVSYLIVDVNLWGIKWWTDGTTLAGDSTIASPVPGGVSFGWACGVSATTGGGYVVAYRHNPGSGLGLRLYSATGPNWQPIGDAVSITYPASVAQYLWSIDSGDDRGVVVLRDLTSDGRYGVFFLRFRITATGVQVLDSVPQLVGYSASFEGMDGAVTYGGNGVFYLVQYEGGRSAAGQPANIRQRVSVHRLDFDSNTLALIATPYEDSNWTGATLFKERNLESFSIAKSCDGNLYVGGAVDGGTGRGSLKIFKIAVDTPTCGGPPIITPSVVGSKGSNDWYVGDVAVSFAVDLKGSAVQSQSGCDPVTVSSDTVATTLTCSVTSRAGTTSQSVTIKRDATAPVVTPVRTPMPNSDNWNNVAVAVSFTGSDATSGVAGCSGGETLSAEAASQSSVAGTCTDNAGNVSAGVSATDINIDMTAPVLTATRSPDANAAGWNNTAVTVTYTAIDALSGVPADACNQAVRVTQNGVDNSVELSCRDRAMNITSKRVTGINIDTIAPTAYATVTPQPNAGGWHNAPATVSFSGTDTLSGSGLAGCAAAVTVSADITGRAVSGSCTDVADNVSAPASVTVNLDQVAPAVTITSPASGASYVQGSSVVAAYSCADARSGVVACIGTVPSGSAASTTTLGGNSFTVTAADVAGNLRTATISYNVVAATPAYTLTPTALAFGSQGLNTSVTQVVTLSSTGGAPIPITSIALSGSASTQYSRTTTCGASVPVGGSCTISVTFRPTSTGSKTATLTVTAGGGAGTKTVALSGTGATASYTVSPTRVSFGSVPRNTTSAAQTVSVTNTSAIAMPITSITLTGSQASQFVQSNNCGTLLAAGKACQVQVSFRPTTTGSKSASLSIVAGAGGGTKTVALSGTGM